MSQEWTNEELAEAVLAYDKELVLPNKIQSKRQHWERNLCREARFEAARRLRSCKCQQPPVEPAESEKP